MRCLNSPSILNALETRIVESIPDGIRHVLVVNAGDGRLARAIREKTGGAAKVSAITRHPEFLGMLDDLDGQGTQAWDLEWHRNQTARHGGYDFVVLYQLHDFWRGDFFDLQRVLGLAQPGATVWTSFLNSQSVRMISRFIPPIRLGLSSLADPLRNAPNIDFASYMDFATVFGGGLLELWGMLDQTAQEYCQKPPTAPVEWETRGTKVSVGSLADAFLWGGSVVGVAFKLKGGTSTSPSHPKVSFSPYSTNLLQGLLLPYPDLQMRQGILGAALLELEAWEKNPSAPVAPVAKFLLEQMGDTTQKKRILLVGSGWGRDLLVLGAAFPQWEWVGYEPNAELAEMGRRFTDAAGLKVVSVAVGERLPFDDASFDGAVSIGFYSGIHQTAASAVAREVRRVTKGTVYHLEDGRGVDHGMQLKSYSLKEVYSDLGLPAVVQPVLVDGVGSGMYLLKSG